MDTTSREAMPRDVDDALFDRESIVPLLLGLVVSLVLCVVVVPTSAKVLLGEPAAERVVSYAAPDASEPPPPAPETTLPPDPPPVPLGNDTPDVAEVAWISHDDYQALVAPTAETVQPALQQMVDPVPEAPPRVDATPPVPPAHDAEPAPEVVRAVPATPEPTAASAEPDPLAPPHEEAAAEAEDPRDEADPSNPVRRREPVPPLEARPDARLAVADAAPDPRDALDPDPSLEEAKETPGTEPAAAPTRPSSQRAVSTPPAGDKPATPTASPRSDREAPPVDIAPEVKEVRVGRVFTAQGIEVKPAVPRISVQTALTSMRGGIRVPVTVTFSPRGRVVGAKLNRRTGYPEIDSPIRASLYRWKASGRKLAAMKQRFRVTIDIIIPTRL